MHHKGGPYSSYRISLKVEVKGDACVGNTSSFSPRRRHVLSTTVFYRLLGDAVVSSFFDSYIVTCGFLFCLFLLAQVFFCVCLRLNFIAQPDE